jgi:hypothetical protein
MAAAGRVVNAKSDRCDIVLSDNPTVREHTEKTDRTSKYTT